MPDTGSTEHMEDLTEGPSKRPKGFGARHLQAVMLFLSIMLADSSRTNLSIAIVAMTETSKNHPNLKVLPWSNAQRGTILGAFFWGYFVTNFLGGHVSRVLGPKYPLLAAMLLCSMVMMFSPFIALNFSWIVFCFSRTVLGLAQGFFYPCIYAHVAKWAPPRERGRIFGFVIAGSHLGIMLTMAVSGYLAASPWGWPSIFYCSGLCGLLWATAWLFVGADSPDSHPSISDSERLYIKSSQPHNSDQSKTLTTPWKAIATSRPVYALFAVSFGHDWGYWMLVTMLPSYLDDVFHFDISENGLISTLPYMLLFILTLSFSWLSDFLIEKSFLTVNFSRKMWNTIAHWGGALALLSMSLLSSAASVVAVLTLSVGLIAGAVVGHRCNHLDLSPNFAGLLMGLLNSACTVSTILGPTVTGIIVADKEDKSHWMIAFSISAAMFFFGNLSFMLFGSTNVQPWNEPPSRDS